MNTVPVTILDNFFDNPDEIRDWALSLDYNFDQTPKFPGKRTENLNLINPPFYKYVYRKIFSLYYNEDINNINFENVGYLGFHLNEHLEGSGWIHQDPNLITFIVYLFPDQEDVNRGTSLFELKKSHHFTDINIEKYFSIARKHYRTNKLSSQEQEYKTQYQREYFKEILNIKDKYNRFISFDPKVYHANNNISISSKQDRLTLIGFTQALPPNTLPPILRSKTITS